MATGQDATQLVVAGSGDIWVAPVGTTLPEEYDDVLHGAFRKVGFVKEDGLSYSSTPQVEEFFGWQSRYALRRELTGVEVMFNYSMLQWNDENIVLAFGGGEVVEVSPGSYRYNPLGDGSQLDELSMIFDWNDGGKLFRVVVPRGNVTDAVEVQLTRTQLAELPVSYKVLGTAGQDPWYQLFNDADFDPASS